MAVAENIWPIIGMDIERTGRVSKIISLLENKYKSDGNTINSYVENKSKSKEANRN
jgi:hypothetical protein